MFLPWLYKPFNLSTVEKLVGVILAMLTYWIDYPVGMATLFMLCGARSWAAWRGIQSIWKARPTCKIQDS